MNNADLVKIKDMLVKITNYIDKSIDEDENGCLHEDNVTDLTTMGSGNKKFKCFDCGEAWEEKFEDEIQGFSETIGKK